MGQRGFFDMSRRLESIRASRWRGTLRIPGVDDLSLDHAYKAMAWLGEEIPGQARDRRAPYDRRRRRRLARLAIPARRKCADDVQRAFTL
jgi:hypothetical protein